MEGTAIVQIGDVHEILTPGSIAFAADGVQHSVKNPGPGRLVVMAILAPPPTKGL
jgi:mannose-6-phosphate isomerase-like protein (cupin superfamily)